MRSISRYFWTNSSSCFSVTSCCPIESIVSRRRSLNRASMKACLFVLQILADKLELALQGDLVLPPFEGHAQQVAEADQQMACSIDVFLHQDSNGVKTVEQKVRM